MEPYAEFRNGILRHIAMEEKIILPAIARWQAGRKADVAERLRLDHGAIVSLMVPPPTHAIVQALRSIFAVHNPREEGPGGLYELLESLAGEEADKILAQLKSTPPVAVLPHNEDPQMIQVTRNALARAGYQLKEG